ncbi:flagellin [Jiella sp. M17.18]|uniref:flagellin N-terminal helical domain-containing protein n=1 Tax=Jiella sp. M17.18 TaxID=3234247 RepID=UPI0034DFD42C
MTSIITNVAAMTALQTLQATNKMMDENQNRISTGYRVADARDNAAYWSIATTMRSDNGAMSAVKDSLGIGAATVDTAYTALNSAKDVLNQIKDKLTTATQDGVDRTKVQDEITQLQEQLKSIANSASFSGQNWLSIDSNATGYDANKQVVANFSRDTSGALTIGTITVDTSKVALFDSSPTGGSAILNGGQGGNTNLGVVANGSASTTTNGSFGTLALTAFATASTIVTLDSNDSISFEISVNGGDAKAVTINKSVVDTALGTTDGKIDSQAHWIAVLNGALAAAGVGAQAVANGANGIDIKSNSASDGTTASSVKISSSAADQGTSVDKIDISKAGTTSDDIKKYLLVVDDAISKVTAGASTLGALQNRIDSQKTFVSNLMDTIDKGIGTLVDADMTEESTKLKALQTQQQLGVQALSIANASSQAILKLFQG